MTSGRFDIIIHSLAFAFLIIAIFVIWKFIREQVQKRNARLAGKPWAYKEDWAKGIISDKNCFTSNVSIFWMWGGVAAVTYGMWTLVPVVLPDNSSINEHAILGQILYGINACLITVGVYLTLRQKIYGESVFRMELKPNILGGELLGTIKIQNKIFKDQNYTVGLYCQKYGLVKSGMEMISQKIVLCQRTYIVKEMPPPDGEIGVLIPVRFEIPRECLETNDSGISNNIFWQLKVDSKSKWIRYSSNFLVPVFGAINVHGK